jgi:hypothetical protein
VAVRVEFVNLILGYCVSFSNGNYSNLGSQDSRHEIATTDISNRGNAVGGIGEICSCEFIVLGPINQLFQIVINL